MEVFCPKHEYLVGYLFLAEIQCLGLLHCKTTAELFTREALYTRIIFHLSKAASTSRALIKALDTDIIIILLGNIHKFPEMKVWMFDKSVVDCSKLATALGPDLCRALPGFHAFTGCDYMAAFFRKGKVRPYKILEKNQQLQTVFASLNESTDLEDEIVIDTLQEFTSQMYSIKNCKRVDTARLEIFQNLYSENESNDFFFEKSERL